MSDTPPPSGDGVPPAVAGILSQSRTSLLDGLRVRRERCEQSGDAGYLDRLILRVEARSLLLPLLPDTPGALERVLREADPRLPDVLDVVERDPGLVLRVWARACSPHYSRPVSDLSAAVLRVGFDELWQLGVCQAIQRPSLQVPELQAAVLRTCEKSVRLGTLVGWISGEPHGIGALAGLLSGVGRLLLLHRRTG